VPSAVSATAAASAVSPITTAATLERANRWPHPIAWLSRRMGSRRPRIDLGTVSVPAI
jgi:hypothetical protein